jgi:glucose-1-phosphate thymidylyltransferase
MKMKGLILAGGTGSRLRPLTYTLPKQMIPIAGKPPLEHAVEKFRGAGINDIGIILGEQWHDTITDHFEDGSDFGVDITYIYQGEPLGLAHAVGCAEQFISDETFVVYLGDDLIQYGLSTFVDQFDPDTYVGSLAVQHVEEPSRYGVININDHGDAVGLIEKPDDPPTDLAAIGIYVFAPEIFDQIREISPSWRDELELSDAIHRSITNGQRYTTHVVEGWWRDVGTPEDVLESNYLALDDIDSEVRGSVGADANIQGRVHTEPGSVIRDGASVVGPVYIGAGTTVESGTYVGPFTTIADDCTLSDCRLERAVVLSNSEITCDQRVAETLVGRNVKVTDKQDGGAKFLLGDNSVIKL